MSTPKDWEAIYWTHNVLEVIHGSRSISIFTGVRSYLDARELLEKEYGVLGAMIPLVLKHRDVVDGIIKQIDELGSDEFFDLILKVVARRRNDVVRGIERAEDEAEDHLSFAGAKQVCRAWCCMI